MKRFGYIVGGALLAVLLAACSSPGNGGTSSAAGSGSRESSAAPASSAASSAVSGGKVQTGPGPQVMEMQVYVQKDSGAEEGYEPAIRLLENGNFEFAAYLYDGTAIISGTYTGDDNGYTLTATDSTARGEEGSNVGEIRLEKTESGVTYSGKQVGVTFDGAEFLSAEE